MTRGSQLCISSTSLGASGFSVCSRVLLSITQDRRISYMVGKCPSPSPQKERIKQHKSHMELHYAGNMSHVGSHIPCAALHQPLFPPPSSHLSAFGVFAARRALRPHRKRSAVWPLAPRAFWSRVWLGLVKSLGSALVDPDQVECHERVVLVSEYSFQIVLWQLLELLLCRFDI
jgi:hypothetical protein